MQGFRSLRWAPFESSSGNMKDRVKVGSSTKMSLFIQWNTLFLEEFFPPAAAGTEVWIHTTRSELDTIGMHLGGAEGLVEAARLGPPWMAARGSIPDIVRHLIYQRRAALRSQDYVDPGLGREEYFGE